MDEDFLLIRKMRQQDENAVDHFIRKYYPDILQYCKCHCMDREVTEDLTQETFEKFFENFTVYRHSGKAKNYLYTIARNLCINYSKKKKEVVMEKLPESEENQVEQTDDRLQMEWILNQLPEEIREIVILYYIQDMRQRDIADVLKIGLPLVKYRVKRAKELLEHVFRKEGME